MVPTSRPVLELPPLTKQSMALLVANAKRIGVLPEDYAKSLVEDGLALQRQVEKTSLAKIMEPVRTVSGQVDDAEILKLVKKARAISYTAHGRRKKS